MNVDTDWEQRVAEFWAAADDGDPAALLRDLRALVDERGTDTPEGMFELASGHDLLGEEDAAVPLYRAALDAGLGGPRRGYAIVQLASSLRNIGEPEEAVRLLTDEILNGDTAARLRTDTAAGEPGAEHDDAPDDLTPAAQAFLALALHDAGRPTEAVRVALLALAPHLSGYDQAVEFYATTLGVPDEDPQPGHPTGGTPHSRDTPPPREIGVPGLR